MNDHQGMAVRNALVIVVDDDAAVRNSLKFSLEVEGFAVRAYADGRELLKEVEFPRGDCLVIDQNMPGMSGLEVLAVLRGRNVLIPAILITSHPDPALRRRADSAGAPIVEKPFLGSALIDGIRHTMARHTPPMR
jgi:FixJ family two-component response regulator